MKNMWESFKEGFFGSFVLAAAIIMALVSVAGAFANGNITAHDHDHKGDGATLV